jgi:hypothetical protein
MNELELQNVSLNNVRELKQPRNNVQQKIAQLADVRRHLALAKTWSEIGMHVIRVGPTKHTNAVKSLGKTMPANAYEALLSGVKWSSSIEACGPHGAWEPRWNRGFVRNTRPLHLIMPHPTGIAGSL